MACEEKDDNCFTFLWRIENISICPQKNGQSIKSPAFVIDAIQKTKWKLHLHPRGNRNGYLLGYFLHREADSKGAREVELEFDLALMGEDGSVLKSLYRLKHSFPKGGDYGFSGFEKLENIFISRRAEFLPRETMTARCRIWMSVGEMQMNYLCSAYTRIGIEKRDFLWQVKNFSNLEPEKKYSFHIKSIENETPLMSLDLSLTGGLSSEEIVRLELSLQDQTIKFCTLELLLVKASGGRVKCIHDELWFERLRNCKLLTFPFTKQELLRKESVYLPDDILSLQWELAFSKGVVLEEIDQVQCGFATPEIEMRDCQDGNSKEPPTHIFNENLKSLYDQQFLWDVKLKTNTSIYPAHKIILSASSPVFASMFSSDTREKNGDFVNIKDLSDDTVRRMLLYIYTARVEDVTWESTSHLYVAADKYGILSLKEICSSILIGNLSPGNACEVLLLAHFHSDGYLKSAAQHYILKHDKNIVKSDEWKMLMETNGKLAAETLCLKYK